MRFQQVTLYTHLLQEQKKFFTEVLAFPLIQYSLSSFTVRIGWTALTFKRSNVSFHYHFCFLLPKNSLQEAMDWMATKVPLIEIEAGRYTQFFPNWNASSFYFKDASGNLLECMEHYDLDNSKHGSFDNSFFLGLNELGMPTDSIPATNHQLETMLESRFWKGDMERFGTHGTAEGMFLLPNVAKKSKWFPTDEKIQISPFLAVVCDNNIRNSIAFLNGKMMLNEG